MNRSQFLCALLLSSATLALPIGQASAQTHEPSREDARLITATQVLEELRRTQDQNVPAWLLQATGIEERRFAEPGETVADLGLFAARDCLVSAGMAAAEIGLVIASSGSSERRFPGPGCRRQQPTEADDPGKPDI